MYTISVLPPKKFEKLPYNDVDVAFGLADKKKGRAYVKESGIPALDLLNVGHEIHELVSNISAHEEDGIRYKKGRQIASIVAPIALGLLTGGTGFSLLGMSPALTGSVLGAAAGGGITQSPMGALGGALGGFGGAGLGSGAAAGWGAASTTPGATLGTKLAGAAQGALFGTGTAMTPMGVAPVKFAGAGLVPAATSLGSAALTNPIGRTATGLAATTLLGGQRQPAANMTQQTLPSYYATAPGAAPQQSRQINLPPAVAATRGAAPTTTEYLPAAFLGPGAMSPFRAAAQNVLTQNPYDIYRRFSFI
jgi:hypothetical protein